ncbi:MAG TPA: ATP-binding cassette domain-containing protein, partial [Anaerolineae bacterium]|nr:ATP-binding cassette domain-containing protein [Anaerolineae bacterium]
IEEQLTEVTRLHLGHSRRKAVDHAVEMLSRVGIPSPEKRISSYPHEFSGGMRQRVMIAMALLCKPDLLIADDTGTIANQIVALLQDADLASRVAQAGRAFVTSRFSWDAVSQRMQVVGQQVRQTRTETSR